MIYLSAPDVGEAERTALIAAFDSGWVAPAGPAIDAFERGMADFLGEGMHAAALSSGTAALHLALQEHGVNAGDDVLVPTFTFAATAFAVTYLGARPCFIDSSPADWNIDPNILSEQLRQRAKRNDLPAAVMTVDLYGQMSDYATIVALCADFDVPLIVDAAEALGAKRDGVTAATPGACAALSFNGNKILTTAGGGMLVSKDLELVNKIRYLASQARQPVSHYEHIDIGYNYRISNLLAAIGNAQLERLPSIIRRRKQIEQRYQSALSPFGAQFRPTPNGSEPNGWLTVMTLAETGVSPAKLCEQLAAANIEARPAWKPMHQQPIFADNPVTGGAVSDAVFAHGVCLPSGSSMTDEDLERVVAATTMALK